MMNVLEYAVDINKSTEEVLRAARILKLDYLTEETDILNEDDIVELDNYFATEQDDVEEAIEEVVVKTPVVEEIKKVVKITKPEVKQHNIKKQKKDLYKNKEKLMTNVEIKTDDYVIFKDNMTVKDFAESINVPVNEIVKKLFHIGIMASVNHVLNFESAELLAVDYNREIKKEQTLDISNFEEFEIVDDPKDLVRRAPVVTIMGHVDHGKTTLLDTIRKANTAAKEVGGITQAISAYQVKYNDHEITFIDTPGHAAFTGMRSRGAQITDIVIIIVAADDGIMPQTREAIDHAKAAGVPIMVAINKMDKEGANPDRIMNELSEYGLVPDVWGGETLYTKISALSGMGIEDLLENIILLADMAEYKANPNRYATGTVIEARLDKNVGAVATLLVQSGTLRVGDPIVVGTSYGKVRTLKNEFDQELAEAKPSQPVSITGISEIPTAGDKFMAFETEKQARAVSDERKIKCKDNACEPHTVVTLDDIFSKIQDGVKEVNVVIKADVNGSSEAIKSSLEKIDVEGVRVKVIRSSVGAITESDVILAKASGAIVIGFNVRPTNEIKNFAKDHNVDIRLYNIIYKAVEEMEAAMKGMLDPEYEEKVIGSAEVRALFKFSKVGTIAGSYVLDGIVKNRAKCRILRNGIVIYDGSISSIQREKDQAKEVKKGLECGITIDNYNDLKEQDIIEVYEMVEIKK